MKICCALLILLATTGCVSSTNESKVRYLTQAEVNHTISILETLEYPMTQSEVMAKLGTIGRNLPYGVIGFGRGKSYRQYYWIELTPPESGREYTVYLWFDQDPGHLSGEAFAAARNIEYVEISFTENEDRNVYTARPARYQFTPTPYTERTMRKD